ncbi:hypothetical protein ACIQU6_39840 [Streptomyces sp. NPDC090442]|uniref:hypothetical protein n=1 Tax=Streptomyces sp. NPDC090442 TaxID=3365962 RepID=UPI0037F463D6
MTSPARTPYQVCTDAGAELDAALRAIGINTDPSTVHVTTWVDDMRLHRVAPPHLTPNQTALLAEQLKAGQP